MKMRAADPTGNCPLAALRTYCIQTHTHENAPPAILCLLLMFKKNTHILVEVPLTRRYYRCYFAFVSANEKNKTYTYSSLYITTNQTGKAILSFSSFAIHQQIHYGYRRWWWSTDSSQSCRLDRIERLVLLSPPFFFFFVTAMTVRTKQSASTAPQTKGRPGGCSLPDQQRNPKVQWLV